jgi:hypothetical protein
MDLANFSRLGNEKEFKELRKLGYEGMNKKLNQYFWYRRTRYFFYIKKILLLVAPIKIPDALRFSKRIKKYFSNSKK